MEVIEVDYRDKRAVDQFLEFPFRLYANVPQWVPPLIVDARRVMDRNRNPFFRDGEAIFLLALEGGRAVGRLAVLDHKRYNRYNQSSTAFFYLFECEDDILTAEALFKKGFDWALQRGLNCMIGPKGFSVFDGMGMLVKGFEYRPAFGLPYNFSYYPQFVEKLGFISNGESVSGYLDRDMAFPEKVHQIAERLQERRGLRVVNCKTKRELKKIIPYLKDMYNTSLAGTSGTVPVSDEEVDAISQQMLWFADPRLIKIVMKGDKPVGFLLAYPDLSAALQKTRGRLSPLGWLVLLIELRRTQWININGAGMIEGYRGVGGTALLFSEMYKSVMESHYKYADIVQIGLDNANMQREMRDMGINFYKVHRLYQKDLT